jgi:hypothetical protein
MPMTKSQVMAEVKKRLPGHSDKELEAGIIEFAQQHPGMEPEQALQALDMYIAQNGAPKPQKNLTKLLSEV